MKFLQTLAVPTAITVASSLLLGLSRVEASTFQFAQVMGTERDSLNYNPLSHGSMGANLLTVTFTGEDLNGDGMLRYFRFGDRSEITDLKVTWGGLEFNFDNLWLFTAGRLPGAAANYYGEDILLHEFRVFKDDTHIDYKPINLYDWYEQFRVYKCPATLNCLAHESIDYPIADGLMSQENLLGFQNYFVPGSPAYLVKPPKLGQSRPPIKSTPEPGAIAGLALLALSARQLRQRSATE